MVAYAGVPLTFSGCALGAFCVADQEPRPWSYEEVRTLKDLAECAMREIELRTRIRETEERLKALEAGLRT
jgi:GAF domain-containing protein